MTVEHWFDRLARPHTRRTTIRVAALAGAGLMLPIGRLPSASATTREPCYSACLEEAATKWKSDKAVCANLFGDALSTAASYAELLTGAAAAHLLLMLRNSQALNCKAEANINWYKAVEACRAPQCGDKTKYPGGNAPAKAPPPPQCTPNEEKACGDICCNVSSDCCFCSSTGRYQCCAAGQCSSCCPGG